MGTDPARARSVARSTWQITGKLLSTLLSVKRTRKHQSPSPPIELRYRVAVPQEHQRALPGLEGRIAAIASAVGLSNGRAALAILGAPGDGKTTAALAYTHKIRDERTRELIWWLDAASLDQLLIGYRDLAAALGDDLAADMQPSVVAFTAIERLTRLSSYLIVLDGAEKPEDLRKYLPRHQPPDRVVILTSTNQEWASMGLQVTRLAAPDLDEVSRYLLDVSLDRDVDAAADIARQLDGYALAIGQAGGYLSTTGVPLRSYAVALQSEEGYRLLARDVSTISHASFMATMQLAVEALHEHSTGAVLALAYLTYLSPIPVPVGLLGELWRSQDQGSDLTLRESLGDLRKYSLLRLNDDYTQLHLHPLVRRALQNLLSEERSPERENAVRAGLLEWLPAESYDPQHWTTAASVIDHVRGLLPSETGMSTNSRLVIDLAHYAGRYLWSVGRFVQSYELFEFANLWVRRANGEKTKEASILNDLAIAHSDLGRPRAAAVNHAAAASLWRTDHSDPASEVWALTGLAAVYRDLGYCRASLRVLTRVRELLPRIGDSDVRNDLECWANTTHANAWCDLGSDPDAVLTQVKADRVWRQGRFGIEHPFVARSWHTEGRIRLMGAEYAESINCVQIAVQIRQALLGDFHPHTSRSRMLLAKGHIAMGEVLAASAQLPLIERGQSTLAPEHPDRAKLLWLRAVMANAGEGEQLLQDAKRLLGSDPTSRILRKRYCIVFPDTSDFLVNPVI